MNLAEHISEDDSLSKFMEDVDKALTSRYEITNFKNSWSSLNNEVKLSVWTRLSDSQRMSLYCLLEWKEREIILKANIPPHSLLTRLFKMPYPPYDYNPKRVLPVVICFCILITLFCAMLDIILCFLANFCNIIVIALTASVCVVTIPIIIAFTVFYINLYWY